MRYKRERWSLELDIFQPSGQIGSGSAWNWCRHSRLWWRTIKASKLCPNSSPNLLNDKRSWTRARRDELDSPNPHRRQWGGTCNPQLNNLSRVGILLRNKTQRMKLNRYKPGDRGARGMKREPCFRSGDQTWCRRQWVPLEKNIWFWGKQELNKLPIGFLPRRICQEPSLEIIWATEAKRRMPVTLGPLAPVMSIRRPRVVQSSCQKEALVPEPTWQDKKGLAKDLNLIELKHVR